MSSVGLLILTFSNYQTSFAPVRHKISEAQNKSFMEPRMAVK